VSDTSKCFSIPSLGLGELAVEPSLVTACTVDIRIRLYMNAVGSPDHTLRGPSASSQCGASTSPRYPSTRVALGDTIRPRHAHAPASCGAAEHGARREARRAALRQTLGDGRATRRLGGPHGRGRAQYVGRQDGSHAAQYDERGLRNDGWNSDHSQEGVRRWRASEHDNQRTPTARTVPSFLPR